MKCMRAEVRILTHLLIDWDAQRQPNFSPRTSCYGAWLFGPGNNEVIHDIITHDGRHVALTPVLVVYAALIRMRHQAPEIGFLR